MFYAIPLENRPSWRHPPWMTMLLIFLNMAVWWGPQRVEEKAEARATFFYAQSVLPAIELPAYLDWLDHTSAKHAKEARDAYVRKQYTELADALNQATPFVAQLRTDQVITPADPRYPTWKAARNEYDAMLPPPFTARWAQDYNPDALKTEGFWPITWLTSAFLHSSTGHLLGNMLFLFLFGFSVELALTAAFGRIVYLAFYLLGAIGASALAAWAYAGQGGLGLGASGAVSALMGMYAVLYRMRRIRFFYQALFYFNYITAPALLLLPAWIINELLQHWLGGRGIAYMAHLGGLLTGAALMGLALMVRRIDVPDAAKKPSKSDTAYLAQVSLARKYTGQLEFERAAAAWKAAARLRPRDPDTLSQWFNLAKLSPASEDFHRCARLIFALPGQDHITLALQHTSYRTYLVTARPVVRMTPDDIARLARRFVRARELTDAERLCRALLRSAPQHPQLADTICVCATALWQEGLRDRALVWLPELTKLAPNEEVTRLLKQA